MQILGGKVVLAGVNFAATGVKSADQKLRKYKGFTATVSNLQPPGSNLQRLGGKVVHTGFVFAENGVNIAEQGVSKAIC